MSLDQGGLEDGAFEEVAPEEPKSMITCRRCRKLVMATSDACPTCGLKHPFATQLGSPADEEKRAASAGQLGRLKTVLWTFFILLATSVIGGLYASWSKIGDNHLDGLLSLISAVEVVDTIAVILAAALMSSWSPDLKERRELWPWVLAWPALAVLLLLNFGYHSWLQTLGFEVLTLRAPRSDGARLAWIMTVMCVQPALVEEWFFRGICWKVLRSMVSPHQTVWVTSGMFAFAHIGVPASLPILFLVGLLVGYARYFSGSLALPMAIHFVHNLIVVLVEPWQ